MVLTETGFREIVKRINHAYPEKSCITKDGLDIWYRYLKDLDEETLKTATDNYIKSSEFPPSIAHLRNECAKIDKHRADVNRELRVIYDRTRGVYPNSADDDDTLKAWWSLIKQKPLEGRIAYALHIESVTLRYVRAIEASDRTEIPTLTEFFKGAR